MRSCKGMISSSQAITATARNSRPLARCIVPIDTWPLTVSACSSRTLNAIPAPAAAPAALEIGDRILRARRRRGAGGADQCQDQQKMSHDSVVLPCDRAGEGNGLWQIVPESDFE